MSIDVHAIAPRRGVDAAFTVATGDTVALLGPNGAGKSTVLSIIAGLIRPAAGHLRVDGCSLDRVPPHRRGIALLSQDPLLFPHLSALDNVAFGAGAGRLSRRDARRQALDHLERLEMVAYAKRRPRELSGGQAQRVAIARALAAEPSVLLLDEPFAAVDADSTPHLRQQVRAVLEGRTAVVITHDIVDALALADRVIVLDQGRVVEEGATVDVLRAPRSAFAASLAGFNIAAGHWNGTAAVTPLGDLQGTTSDVFGVGDAVVALVRPSAIAVFTEPPGGSIRNHVTGPISRLEPLGDRMRVRIEVGGIPFSADITAAAVAELALVPGQVVTLAAKATEVTILASSRA